MFVFLPSPLFSGSQEFTASRRAASPARTTMMNAMTIASHFFLSAFPLCTFEDGFTTVPSLLRSEFVRSFVLLFFNWEYFVGLVWAAASASN